MKKFIIILLSMLLVFNTSIIAYAQENTATSVMRLESIVGTITVLNQSGKELTARENMRLQNGYTISTDAASYAYIGLDDTKSIKLDGLTTCTIKKNGGNLEILLETGKIVYDVSAPLKPTETMSIRTSTMVTGIRGTIGMVEVISTNESKSTVFEGVVQNVATNHNSNNLDKSTTRSGEVSTALRDTTSTEVIFVNERIVERNTPGFAAIHISDNDDIQKRIMDDSDIDIDEILEFAYENKEDDEEEQLKIEREADEQDDDDDDDDSDDDLDDDDIVETDFDSIIIKDDDDDLDDTNNGQDDANDAQDDTNDTQDDVNDEQDDTNDVQDDVNDKEDDTNDAQDDANDGQDDVNDGQDDANDE